MATKTRAVVVVKKKVLAKSVRPGVKTKVGRAGQLEITTDDAPATTKKIKTEKTVTLASYAKGIVAPQGIPGMNVDLVLTEIEKKVGAYSSGLSKNEKRMSSGMLMLDVMLGGGYTAGWYTNFGAEQSTKTTEAVTVLAASLLQGVPILSFWDFEGSTGNSLDYIDNILKTMGIKTTVGEVFGVKDQNGKYIVKPRVRYKEGTSAEAFFDYIAALERRLPDKIYENKKWWFVYLDNKENRAFLKATGDIDKLDSRRSKGSKKLYIEAPDGRLQALIITDSYPAMLPERLDVDDPKAGLAAVARMFSENIPRVKGKLRRKRICILGVNQLRKVPMAMYGPSEAEPAGQALQFYSDARVRFSSRSISAVKWAKKSEGNQEQEKGINGGLDTYRYVHAKAIKNKLSQPYIETFLRLWISDSNGAARGYDPVFDTFNYLRETGQITSNKRDKIQLNIEGNTAKRTIGWTTFKRLILGTKEEMKDIYTALGMKPMLLRQWCFKQIASGAGLTMYFEFKNRPKEEKEDEAAGDDDDLADDAED